MAEKSDVLESLKRLYGTEEFQRWKEKHENTYLSHAFMMYDPHMDSSWEFGFCDAKNEVTVFEVKERIVKRDPQAAFKKDSGRIPPLDEKKIKITTDDVITTVDGLLKEKYANQKPMKVMIVIQTLPVGQCWNVSYVLHSFKILNVKIGTENKKDILEEKLLSIISEG